MTCLARLATVLAAGLLFGFGLALSGMMDPSRVLGFLDLAGPWDPSLAFVLAGAVGVSAIGYAVANRMRRPVFAAHFDVPTSRAIDPRLIGGAALFGIGWGLVGLCPGPALAALPLGITSIFIFIAAMLGGMAVYAFAAGRRLTAAH